MSYRKNNQEKGRPRLGTGHFQHEPERWAEEGARAGAVGGNSEGKSRHCRREQLIENVDSAGKKENH